MSCTSSDRVMAEEPDPSRLAALAEFAAGAGHEINNPLATIIGYAQQLLANETDPDRRHALATIGGQAFRIRDMIGDLMLFARPPQPKFAAVDLSDVLQNVVAALTGAATAAGITLAVAECAPTQVQADAGQLRVALGALIQNAIEATPSSGQIDCAITSLDVAGSRLARVQISDTGRGFTPVERAHLFDPFFSGRQAGRGLGFGLCKAWRIVDLHGGRIAIACPPTGGSSFTIDLPKNLPAT